MAVPLAPLLQSKSASLDRLEAAMRGLDGGEPAHGLICGRLIYDPSEWQIEEDEAISRMKTEELDPPQLGNDSNTSFVLRGGGGPAPSGGHLKQPVIQ